MNTLQEIIQQPLEQPHDVSEMEFAVAEYIRARKGVTVKVDICKGIPMPMPPEYQHYYLNQVALLNNAFITAVGWFRQNPDKL